MNTHTAGQLLIEPRLPGGENLVSEIGRGETNGNEPGMV